MMMVLNMRIIIIIISIIIVVSLEHCFPLYSGTEGQRCEVHSYGLDELSFLLFPPLEPAPATHVSLRFATTHSNGLLLFIAEPSSAEILALKNSSFLAAQLPTRFPFESLGHSLHFSQPLYSTSFFALEIKSGQLQLTYNLGGGAFKLKTKQLVTDGQFHTISVHRMGMVSMRKSSCITPKRDSKKNQQIKCQILILF